VGKKCANALFLYLFSDNDSQISGIILRIIRGTIKECGNRMQWGKRREKCARAYPRLMLKIPLAKLQPGL